MELDHPRTAQITSELEDCKRLIIFMREDIAHIQLLVIGSDYSQFRIHLACCFANVAIEPSFTDWLFEEAAKGVSGPEIAQSPLPAIEQPTESEPLREATSNIVNDSSRTAPGVSRNGVYQQAITQALPPTATSAQKRTASARSPSPPNHPNKSRRTDLPVGPRAMYRDANSNSSGNPHPNSRSLLDRVGGPPGRSGPKNFQRDEIQARIDNIVGNTPDPNMMMAAGFPGMGMDMNAIAAANMANPIMLQEMMMNQMALMAQMASSMGIINPNTGQFAGPGFPMQQGMSGVMPGDMGMFPNGMINGLPQQSGNNGPMNGAGRGRGSVRGARGSSRGQGSVSGNSAGPSTNTSATTIENPQIPPPPIVLEPKPVTPSPPQALSAVGLINTPATSQQPAYAIPDRPQSPTLCKFALKCTNAHCRYSHPSPVATAESGVVLSNEACANGKECKDKDCIKAHVSPAVLNPLGKFQSSKISTLAYLLSSAAEQPAPAATAPHVHHTPGPCRFGATCTRPNCTFSHPPRPSHNHFAQQCRFGAGCTRAQCPFQHPEGRVLPSSFHRGLATTGPMISVQTPEPGSMGGPSPHRSVTFNSVTASANVKEKLEQQMKEIQEKKREAERAVRNAEAAAGKKDEAKPVSIAV